MKRALLVPMVLAGCIDGAGYSTRDRVTLAAREYNEGVRWGQLDKAGNYLPKESRDRFFEKHKAVEDELEIADYEMTRLEVVKGKKNKATARLEYQWSLKRRGLVEKTVTEQAWEELDGKWLMCGEKRISGAPLTLFEERRSDEKPSDK
jgi:hypothetical protein